MGLGSFTVPTAKRETSWVGRFPPTPHRVEVTHQRFSDSKVIRQSSTSCLRGIKSWETNVPLTCSPHCNSFLSLPNLPLQYSKDVLQRCAFLPTTVGVERGLTTYVCVSCVL
jgi:hypothetical protein